MNLSHHNVYIGRLKIILPPVYWLFLSPVIARVIGQVDLCSTARSRSFKRCNWKVVPVQSRIGWVAHSLYDLLQRILRLLLLLISSLHAHPALKYLRSFSRRLMLARTALLTNKRRPSLLGFLVIPIKSLKLSQPWARVRNRRTDQNFL